MRKNDKNATFPPISMEVHRQLIFDVAMDMTGGGAKDHPNWKYADSLLALANQPILGPDGKTI